MTSTSLQLASSWLNDSQINESWAKKYDLDFNKTVEFIKESQKVHGDELKKQEGDKKRYRVYKKKISKISYWGSCCNNFCSFHNWVGKTSRGS